MSGNSILDELRRLDNENAEDDLKARSDVEIIAAAINAMVITAVHAILNRHGVNVSVTGVSQARIGDNAFNVELRTPFGATDGRVVMGSPNHLCGVWIWIGDSPEYVHMRSSREQVLRALLPLAKRNGLLDRVAK